MVGSTESDNEGLCEGVKCHPLRSASETSIKEASHEQSKKGYRRVLTDCVWIRLVMLGDSDAPRRLTRESVSAAGDVPGCFRAGHCGFCGSEMDYRGRVRRRQTKTQPEQVA